MVDGGAVYLSTAKTGDGKTAIALLLAASWPGARHWPDVRSRRAACCFAGENRTM
jgi:hypothetical protein